MSGYRLDPSPPTSPVAPHHQLGISHRRSTPPCPSSSPGRPLCPSSSRSVRRRRPRRSHPVRHLATPSRPPSLHFSSPLTFSLSLCKGRHGHGLEARRADPSCSLLEPPQPTSRSDLTDPGCPCHHGAPSLEMA